MLRLAYRWAQLTNLHGYGRKKASSSVSRHEEEEEEEEEGGDRSRLMGTSADFHLGLQLGERQREVFSAALGSVPIDSERIADALRQAPTPIHHPAGATAHTAPPPPPPPPRYCADSAAVEALGMDPMHLATSSDRLKLVFQKELDDALTGMAPPAYLQQTPAHRITQPIPAPPPPPPPLPPPPPASFAMPSSMPPGYEWGGYRHEPTRQQSSLYHDAHAAQRQHEQQQQAAAAALANKRALSRDLMQTARVNAAIECSSEDDDEEEEALAKRQIDAMRHGHGSGSRYARRPFV